MILRRAFDLAQIIRITYFATVTLTLNTIHIKTIVKNGGWGLNLETMSTLFTENSPAT